jgi:hypothetical protein
MLTSTTRRPCAARAQRGSGFQYAPQTLCPQVAPPSGMSGPGRARFARSKAQLFFKQDKSPYYINMLCKGQGRNYSCRRGARAVWRRSGVIDAHPCTFAARTTSRSPFEERDFALRECCPRRVSLFELSLDFSAQQPGGSLGPLERA